MISFKWIATFSVLILGVLSIILLGEIPLTEGSTDGFILGLGLYCGSLILFALGFSRFRNLQLVKDTPTSKIRSMAMGTVEIKGKVAELSEKLETPFTGKECVYYRYTVEEYRHDDDGGDWVTIDRGEARKPFSIDDGTGSAVIEPESANIDIPRDKMIKVEGSEKPPKLIQDFIENNRDVNEGSNEWISLIDNDRRYSEWYITPKEEVYVFGYAEEERDGNSSFPVINGGKAPMFYISDRSEKEIRNRWSWTYKAMIAGGIIGTPLGYMIMAAIAGL